MMTVSPSPSASFSDLHVPESRPNRYCFKTFDSCSENGTIEFAEFLQLMATKMKETDQEQILRDAFKVGNFSQYSSYFTGANLQ